MRRWHTLVFMVPLMLAGVAGAAAEWAFDPELGRSRRTRLRDQAAGKVRRTARNGRRTVRRVGAQSEGLTKRAWHSVTPHDDSFVDDIALAQRVESHVFRNAAIPKGRLNIDAADGTVVLRGSVEHPNQIHEIESAVAKVPGVRKVDSLLHLEGTPAPNKADAIAAGER